MLNSSVSHLPPRTPPNMHQSTIDPSAKCLVQNLGGTGVGEICCENCRVFSSHAPLARVASVCISSSLSCACWKLFTNLAHPESRFLPPPILRFYYSRTTGLGHELGCRFSLVSLRLSSDHIGLLLLIRWHRIELELIMDTQCRSFLT